MNLFCSLAIAFSMYSRIPMPTVAWTKERMKYAMCFFPLIGVVISAITYGSVLVLTALKLDWMARIFRSCTSYGYGGNSYGWVSRRHGCQSLARAG